jgi:uncharacterized integral membrane protein
MGNLWLKIKVWTKVIAFALVLIYVVLFIINNSENQATLWFWFGRGKEVTTSVLKLVAITFFIGVLVAVLTRTTLRTIRQIQDLRGRQAAERKEREAEQRGRKKSEGGRKAAVLRSRPESAGAATEPIDEHAHDERVPEE